MNTPASPPPARPMSAMMRPPRSASRMSLGSRAPSRSGGSRASDEDGKTSVKVAVRVRPPLQPGAPGFDGIPLRRQSKVVHVANLTNIAIDSPQGRKLFVFDRVFGEDIDQEGIWEYLQESIDAFIQGFNVSVLAYGQSGAGKSYTMGTSGPSEQENNSAAGVIPRAAIALFQKLGGEVAPRIGGSGIRAPVRYSTSMSTLQRNNPDKGWTMKATYVEIYNETLRDLLLPEGTRPDERAPITIREDTKGRILLTGLRQVEINSVEDILGALNHGSTIRQTDATAVNAKSSRSHAVFSLNLVQRKHRQMDTERNMKRMSMPLDMNQDSIVTVDSKMHFVDLAGSERLKNTHAQGDRAKEGISINAGLASLGKVISQLSTRAHGTHVSYRDSKLTRLLQDSLGGNAITYMIACVTPVEFHLGETLNTVQYAQRARAIQSKPAIQQITDDGDLKQLVDRLRSEIAFLREQLKNTNNSESNDRPKNGTGSRGDRSNEKEIELQNQLLDLQENYSALSQRHAKLISEIARARDPNEGMPHSDYADSAIERLNRSNSLSEAVEAMVLEYEETIRSLEASLSSTRGSLANSESCLLEKESRLAYSETMNQQLQNRLQKMVDREASNEAYLVDLETKLEGQTSGEEKQTTIINELKKEISRVRENEASCEDYISTLEERLAESEQDMELMRREIDRLEHVVERQRSLGKLDNLLSELDSVRQQENGQDANESEKPTTDGAADDRKVASRPSSTGSRKSLRFADAKEVVTVKPPTPTIVEPEPTSPKASEQPHVSHAVKEPEPEPTPSSRPVSRGSGKDIPVTNSVLSPATERLQEELLHLKIEHESTLTEFEQLAANYEAVLRNLGELQDQLDEMKHSKNSNSVALTDGTSRGTSPPQSPVTRPTSFLADSRVRELNGLDGHEHPSSPLSLSSELSMDEDSSTEMDEAEIEKMEYQRAVTRDRENVLMKEVEQLRREKDEARRLYEKEQEELQVQLRHSLDTIAELRVKERKNGVRTPPSTLLRRKSNQALGAVDRAQRAFTNLRRIAHEHFEQEQDILDNFELNIDSAARELQNRSDRIQELEKEVTSIRKDMDAKVQMIAGLTRERTSIQTSPMDISVVAVMERRIEESEGQIHDLKIQLTAREQELESAKKALETRAGESQSDVLAVLEELTKERALTAEQKEQILELQKEIEHIKADNDLKEEALESLQKSKATLEETLRGIESELARARADSSQHEQKIRISVSKEIASYQHRIETLEGTISANKSVIDDQLARVVELEKAHAEAQKQISEQIAAKSGAFDEDLQKHQQAVSDLELLIAQNKEIIEAQQGRLETLEQSYEEATQHLEELRKKESNTAERMSAEAKAHSETQQKLVNAQAELEDAIQKLNTLQLAHDEATASLEKLGAAEQEKATETQAELQRQIDEYTETIRQQNETIVDLRKSNEEAHANLLVVQQKERKHEQLLEDLEQQLTITFDQNQETQTRLAALVQEHEALKADRDAMLSNHETKSVDVARTIEALNNEIAILKTKLSEAELELASLGANRAQRSNSTSSNNNLRKSSSTVSLPSPPPAIPLPPLPPTSSPPSTVNRRPSKDYVNTHFEDQEARIKTLEKQLQAEKALTATLEEALTDCEKTMKRLTSDRDSFQAKATQVQAELDRQRNESQSSRYSMQAVEEERQARQKAEQAREQLELRMQALQSSKNKKRSFACF